MSACACGAQLGAKNKSGLCRSCVARRNNADPVVIANRVAGIRRHFAQPHARAASAARLAVYMATMSDDERERRRVAGLTKVNRLIAASRAMSADVRAENGRKRSATVLAWCPPEWRDKYRSLTAKGKRAPEARRIVETLIAGGREPGRYVQQHSRLAWCPPARREEYDRVRRALGAAEARRIIEADLTPFERQLARVAAGAGITTKFVPRRAAPDMTLGGVAPEAI